MDSSKYVKQIGDGKWEVKLGAGILPIVITNDDRLQMAMVMASTFLLPRDAGSLEEFKQKARAVAAVNEFIANNRAA
jgi:hypothetical protein